VQNLKAVIEQRLDRMLRHNPLKTDFRSIMRKLSRNTTGKRPVTIERTFEASIDSSTE
jgi:hypothetical protein